jgi:hypothetical protein
MILRSFKSLLTHLTLLTAGSGASISTRQAAACNNSPSLCSQPYDQITHLGAHDSPFLRDASTGYSTAGNQFFNTSVQLSSGIRLVSAQVHESNGDYHLCHTSCDLLDAGLLSEWLVEIKEWLEQNPNEVVTVLLVNSDNANAQQLGAEFSTANITEFAYVPSSPSVAPAAGSWPTLQTLISSGKRLMVFVANMPSTQTPADLLYLQDEFTFIFENPFDQLNASDFTCTPDRPSSVRGNPTAAIASNRMALLNQFLDKSAGIAGIEIPDVDAINITNSPDTTQIGTLGHILTSCHTEYGRSPTFVLTDFATEGNAMAAVDAINGVTSPVGRVAPPPISSTKKASKSDVTFQGVDDLNQMVKDGQKPSVANWIWAAGQWSWGGINLSGGNVFQ